MFQRRGYTVSQISPFSFDRVRLEDDALPLILRSELYQTTSIVKFAQGYKASDFGKMCLSAA